MATSISRKEARNRLRDSILKTAQEISISPASKRVQKVVKNASKKIGKVLAKDLKKLESRASKLVKKEKKKNKKAKKQEPVAVAS